jgi:hypothetical protein
MDVDDYEFIEIIDYILLNSDDDIKMKNAIPHIETLSKQKGMSIYQIMFDMFHKNITKKM